MQKFIIVRGLPGSGKSTIAKQIALDSDMFHYEADMYFVDKQGNYDFDQTKLGSAHMWCQRMVESRISDGMDVIVSNTFTTCKEMKPYFEIAKKYGIIPNVIHAQNMFDNIHLVPDEALKRMRDRFQYDLSSLFNYLKD